MCVRFRKYYVYIPNCPDSAFAAATAAILCGSFAFIDFFQRFMNARSRRWHQA